MANPRKFSEKIALQKQKQAEGTAEFEKIMKEVYATRRDEPLSASQQRISECCLSPEQGSGGSNGGGGSGGGGNAGGGLVGIPIPGSGGGSSGNGNGGSGSPSAYRESRGRSVGVGPMRRPSDRKVDRSPYSSSLYLSPPMDTSWRRSNSDSAIHQSLILQPENPIYGTQQQQQQHYLQQQQYHQNPRSHSTAASVGLSPTAQRRKAQHMVTQSHSSSNLQHMQMQDQLNHHKLNNHNHQQLNHMHPHQQSSMAKSQLQQFNSCAPTNSLFKPLQEQAMALANTGSLPDLTSVHFSNVPSPSPTTVNTHNMRNEREQLQSPFNSQTYQQQQQQQQQQQLHQQHSPGGGQTHLSFTNLPVMVNPSSNHISTNCGTLHSSYGNLPTTGNGGNGGGGISANTASSGNLSEYRNPQHNPPSPAGSASPGLMVAASPHDIHNSAPNSPIRHSQHQHQQQQHQYSDKNIQTYDRFSPSGGGGGGDYSNGSSNLNPSFHNHFEQFSLVDSAQSDPQYIPSSLQQDIHSPHNSYSQSLQFDDSLFGHPQQQFSPENGNGAGAKVSGGVTGTTGGDPYLSLSNQNTLNNCSSSNLGLNSNSGGGGSSNNNSSSGVTNVAGTASANCSPLHSPHSPNPHSPSNNNSNIGNDIVAIAQQQQHHQQQQQQQQQQQHQKSHHTNDVSGRGGGVSNNSSNMHNSTPTSTTPNIPSIVFSDFSSINQDYSKEIFDTLDLDLGQMDPAGLQMLSDPTSMIADPNIEDSFRRDLN